MEYKPDNVTESLLHPKIAALYQIVENPVCNYPWDKCLLQNGTYEWDNVTRLFSTISKSIPKEAVYPKLNEECLRYIEGLFWPKTYDECVPYVRLLQPVVLHSELLLASVIRDSSWVKKLNWLGQSSQISCVLDEYQNPNSSRVTMAVENLLFLTAALENGLAGVYTKTRGKSAPHLLHDLIDNLNYTLLSSQNILLQVLIGLPESLNLRNIVWHGFPLPHEIPSCFVATLLIMCASLGDFMKNIKPSPRRQVNDFDRFLSRMRSSSIKFALVDNASQVMATIESSKWTGQWKVYWKQVYHHYANQNYWRCLVLILPQIELVLRKIYGEVNSFDVRAKINEYYITMKTIFEYSDNNRIFDCHLSRGTLYFLYDIFISPLGMRIRDKVSHGEANLDCADKNLCSLLLYAGLNLLNASEFPLDDYKVKFHLNCLTYEALVSSKRFVFNLLTMSTPKNLGFNFPWSPEVKIFLQELEITEKLEIFNRPRKEPEIMSYIMRIAQMITQTCENYQMAFNDRFAMSSNHELRSRARRTLERMVESMGVISDTLVNILGMLARIHGSRKCFETYIDECQKFCKHTLKVAEKFVRYSDKESNEWLNAMECCTEFINIKLMFGTNL